MAVRSWWRGGSNDGGGYNAGEGGNGASPAGSDGGNYDRDSDG